MKKISRKIYEKPSVKTEKVIETAALACGKCISGNPINQASCNSYKRLS